MFCSGPLIRQTGGTVPSCRVMPFLVPYHVMFVCACVCVRVCVRVYVWRVCVFGGLLWFVTAMSYIVPTKIASKLPFSRFKTIEESRVRA